MPIFDAAEFINLYDSFSDLFEPVTLCINNSTGFDDHLSQAFVTGYTERDMVYGDSIQQGDVKLILRYDDIPAAARTRPLQRKDRIIVRGRPMAVEHWNENTRSVGNTILAIEARVRA